MISNERENALRSSRGLREHLLADRYRPGYHFSIPEDIGMPGDPNGAFYANGRYHLMYLYNRRGITGWNGNGFCWGHISSSDLVHWRHHADALLPGDGDGGCFSGGAFVDEDGTAYITYWRLPLADGNPEGTGIGIARSSDRHYDKWEKVPVPTLSGTEFGIREIVDAHGNTRCLCNADPSNIWKKDGAYYLQAGNLLVLGKTRDTVDAPAISRGDWVDLFRSKDLVEWEYLHRFYERDATNRWTDESEDDMCPSFLPLPLSAKGGGTSGKHLQLFISHNKGCQYYVGEYDENRDLFIPETHGRMTWVDNTFFAPEALIDGLGRQIMWAWLTDNPRSSVGEEIEDGWSGVYGLPRVLWLGGDNTLCMAPALELNALRYNAQVFDDVMLQSGDDRTLEGINGESVEIVFSVGVGTARQVGLKVRTSPGGEETTLLYCDRDTENLVFDSTKSGELGRKVVERAPFAPETPGRFDLRVFVDKSVIEIFADDRQAISRRVYPVRDDSLQVRLFCRGGDASISGIRTWEMMPSNSW